MHAAGESSILIKLAHGDMCNKKSCLIQLKMLNDFTIRLYHCVEF